LSGTGGNALARENNQVLVGDTSMGIKPDYLDSSTPGTYSGSDGRGRPNDAEVNKVLLADNAAVMRDGFFLLSALYS
jgi:hypothetical protein